ncbi:MAG: GIY-YIG nuclease family protein [Gallionella sp.]
MGCLYQLIFPNGKSYIGISSNTAEQRFKAHCQNSKNGITEYPDYSPKEKAVAELANDASQVAGYV